MTRNEAKTLWIASFEAAAKLNRNLKKAQFIAMQPHEADPFVVYADLLERLRARTSATQKAAIEATVTLGGHEILPEVIAEAESEWRKAA